VLTTSSTDTSGINEISPVKPQNKIISANTQIKKKRSNLKFFFKKTSIVHEIIIKTGINIPVA
jgi:hypothetical protein